MIYQDIEKYEYKSPSYELLDRKNEPKIDFEKYKNNARFTYTDKMYRSKAEDKDSITMLFTGDLLCQENMFTKHTTVDGDYDFKMCFDFVKPLFKSADFVAGNLETSISATAPYRGEILSHEGPYYCNAPVRYLEALAYAGFDMLTTANNHTIDAGVRGMFETIDNTNKFGIIQTGTFKEKMSKYVVVDICGFKVGFTAFSLTYNQMDGNMTKEGKESLLNTYKKESAELIYNEMKQSGAEVVVCFPHWGEEYTDVITDKQRKMSEELTEIGYDFVVGSHAHVIQRFATVNGKPVLYSLGNLISHLNTKSSSAGNKTHTVIYSLKLTRVENKIKSEIEFIPCNIVKNYRGIPFTVLPVNEQLNLTPESEKSLKSSVGIVEKLLEDKTAVVSTSAVVTKEALADFEEMDKNLLSRTELLRKEEKKESIQKVKEMISKTGEYIQNTYGMYKEHGDYFELCNPVFTKTVINLKEINKAKEVKIISNTQKQPNDIVRLIYLSKNIEVIGESAFENYTNVESVRFYNKLKVIENKAFKGCTKITGLIMPASLKKIGDYAFENCSSLLSIKIPSSVKEISNNAFVGCNKLTIYCEKGSYAEEYAKNNNIPFKNMPLAKKQKTEKIEKASQEVLILEDWAWDTPKSKQEIIQFISAGAVMGPMNKPTDKHPRTIIESCEILGLPLPEDAECGNQPHVYIDVEEYKKYFDGSLENIVKAWGDKAPKYKKEFLETKFKSFKRKYKTQKNIIYTDISMAVYFTDWILFAIERGFTHNCYFDYELYNKEMSVRDTFLNEGFRTRIHKACNEKEQRVILLDKAKFNKTFAKYVKRDWVDSTTCSFEEFKAFIEKHEKFFGKPVRGTGGEGARVINSDSEKVETLFEICKEENLICEEIIQQHEDLARVNASTLNTVRVNTLLCADGVARVTLTVARFGRSGNVVDNFHGGGVGGIVDIDTGIIITEAIDRAHMRQAVHPDSKVKLLGFQYPHWDKVVAAVCDAATLLPGIRHVGWDVSVTKDGEIEFVEGNGRPNFDVLQSPDQVGRRFRYLKYIEEIEKLKGIKPKKSLSIVLKKDKALFPNEMFTFENISDKKSNSTETAAPKTKGEAVKGKIGLLEKILKHFSKNK